MLQFENLSPLMQNLHADFTKLYFMLLPVFFALAVCLQWFRSPSSSIDFMDIAKRAVISTLLLVAFPEISKAVIAISDGIAERIDNIDSTQAIIDMAAKKAESYTFSKQSILLAFDDLLISIMTFLSYMLLLFARYLTVAMYNFFWVFLSVIAPLTLLFNLFPGTSHITANLFRSMIEVASWKVVWAILGAMLTSLAFVDVYKLDGAYATLTIMNTLFAVAMLATPLVVRALVGGGVHNVSSAIGPAAVLAMGYVAKAGVGTLAKAGNQVRQWNRPRKKFEIPEEFGTKKRRK